MIRVSFYICFLLSFSFSSMAQDVTIYTSPHDLEVTISKIHLAIDKNEFSYLQTTEYDSDSSKKDGKHNIHLITFTSSDVQKLAECEPTAMLDMPLKILVWSEEGDTYIGCTNSINFKRRYKIVGCEEVLTSINRALIRVINDAIRTH